MPCCPRTWVRSRVRHDLTGTRRKEGQGGGETQGVALSQAARDLDEIGLPWLERHLTWEGLPEALLARVSAATRPDSNSLMFLSRAYEAKGDFARALDAWRRYRANLDRLVEGSDAEQVITARERALSSRLPSE